MINLFRFLIRNSSFFLFVLFEIIAFYLIVNYNQTQKNIFVNSSNSVTGAIMEKSDQLHDYFNLKDINQDINRENSALLRKIQKIKSTGIQTDDASFEFKDAKVISNQINGRYNRFLINKGRSNGIAKGMGVTFESVPVGIVYQVTSDHASVISLLNVNFNLSASIRDKGHFGTLSWQPSHPKRAALNHIPAYADVLVGDTVVTSGYSSVFPEGLGVGVVEKVVTPTGSNSYDIDVTLFANIDRMNYVQIIENIDRSSLDSLTSTLGY